MKKYILVTGICFSLLLPFFLSGLQISFQEESYYEVSSNDDDYEPSDTEDEWEII